MRQTFYVDNSILRIRTVPKLHILYFYDRKSTAMTKNTKNYLEEILS